MDVLTNLNVVISMIYVYIYIHQIIMLYTLHLQNSICHCISIKLKKTVGHPTFKWGWHSLTIFPPTNAVRQQVTQSCCQKLLLPPTPHLPSPLLLHFFSLPAFILVWKAPDFHLLSSIWCGLQLFRYSVTIWFPGHLLSRPT